MKLLEFLKSKTFWLNAILALTFYGLLGLSGNSLLKGLTSHSSIAVVPDVSGMKLSDAEVLLEELDLQSSVMDSSVFHMDYAPGSVVKQYPLAGSTAKTNRIIQLTINRMRPEKISMPDLLDRTLKRAELEITSRGLRIGRITYVPDLAKGIVLGFSSAGKKLNSGDQVRKGSSIDLIVAKQDDGPTKPVPNVLGMTFNEAKTLLAVQGLKLEVADGDTTRAGVYVVQQSPQYSEGRPTLHVNGIVHVWIGEEYLLQANDEQ